VYSVGADSLFSVSYLAGLIGGWFLKSRKAEKILNIAAGSVFTVLAVKLALTRQ
jgi:threonine/homoserine/homoserine lactone efflux protein